MSDEFGSEIKVFAKKTEITVKNYATGTKVEEKVSTVLKSENRGPQGVKGDKGDRGEQGIGASFSTFVYEAPTASSLWTITHNLACYPSVTIVDSAGTVIVPDIEYLDINSLRVIFAYAMGGTAYLN